MNAHQFLQARRPSAFALKFAPRKILPEFAHSYSLIALGALCLCTLVACASLPPMDAVVAASEIKSSAAPLQIEGPKGMLPVRQGDAILSRLNRDAPETNIFERHLALENSLSSEPLTSGNKVVLLQDGPSTYAAMNRAIASAKDHINMETYIVEDDAIGQSFSKALIEKQRAGVQVNFIYDSVGSINTPRDFFDQLREGGISVLEFNPVNPLTAKKGWEINQRDHRKLLIVDGKTVLLGGINISAVYSGGSFGRRSKLNADVNDGAAKVRWRDTDIQIDGPVVASFQRLFLETWNKQKGAPIAPRNYFPPLKAEGREVIRAIASSSDDASARIYTTLISAISSAETSIAIINAYFVPDAQLLDALKQAVKRGVNVKIVLPGKTDSALVFHAGRSYYQRMLDDGIEIYERQEKLLHSKTVLIDGVWASVGSPNLDWRSFLHNDEVTAVVLGTDFGQQMASVFAKDLAASEQITPSEWKARHLMWRIKESAARVWAYWL